jgi:sugar lactone lactonase YvrE
MNSFLRKLGALGALFFAVTLHAQAPAIVVDLPANQQMFAGFAEFNYLQIFASGAAPLRYQWFKDGVAIANATDASLQALMFSRALTLADAGTYRVVVSNAAGSVTSGACVVTIAAPLNAPSIAEHPLSVSVAPGGQATFTARATNGYGLPMVYQWYKDVVNPVTGATSPTLTLNNVTAADAGRYYMKVDYAPAVAPSRGYWTTEATLTVTAPVASAGSSTAPAATPAPAPVRLVAPISQAVASGRSVTLTAGSGASFQWQVSTDGGATWRNLSDDLIYSGTRTASLTISGATADLNGYRFRYVATANGTTTTSAASVLSVAPITFPHPSAVTVDTSANLVVSDAAKNTLARIDTAGKVSRLAGADNTAGAVDGAGSAALFNQPAGLAIAANGVVYVTDSGNGTIRQVSAAGAVTTLAGSTTLRGSRDGTGADASFTLPSGLAVGPTGNLYVADAMSHTIRRVSAAGVVTTLAGRAGQPGATDGPATSATFNHPTGLAVDAADNVYVADTYNNLIRKISAAGFVSTVAGVECIAGTADGTGRNALFNQPTALALDAAGNLYVADTASSTVRKITPAAAVTTLAGLPTVAGFKDGTGLEAWLNQPKALAVDRSGNVWVADTGNAALRKISPSGEVTTPALSVQTDPAPTAPVATSTPATTSPTANTPTTTTTTTGAPAATSTTSSGGAGGGGGAVTPFFLTVLGLLALARFGRPGAKRD